MTNNEDPVDLLIVGGGINGCGIACDAAGRGARVVLVEQGDLGSATSSASSKLIHGGLRYLEYYQFRLVREALAEREVMLGKAAHIIWPVRFVLPHANHTRAAWMVRLGLFLYDHLARRSQLPNSAAVSLAAHPWGAPLKASVTRAFAYSDCWVDDARLVVLNALQAAQKGAVILPRTRFLEASRDRGIWQASIEDRHTGATRTLRARVLVNAAGPWVEEVLATRLRLGGIRKARLVKGAHIVVPKIYDGDHAYILQQPDQRVVFALPYERDFTLIGTTEIAWLGSPAEEVSADAGEVTYLCNAVNGFFENSVSADDVIWTYAGIRPLLDDRSQSASAVTRDYVLDLNVEEGEGTKNGAGNAPLLSVFGGKITTYRRLAERALEKLKPYLPGMGAPWTAAAVLPGGDLPEGGFDAFAAAMEFRYSGLDPALVRALCHRYGSRVPEVLGDAVTMAGLGREFGGGLYELEVDYLIAQEWAETAEDILWRRTKAGLHMKREERATFERSMMAHGKLRPERKGP
jgi:glycerol-3-phosphate dehydrogenase